MKKRTGESFLLGKNDSRPFFGGESFLTPRRRPPIIYRSPRCPHRSRKENTLGEAPLEVELAAGAACDADEGDEQDRRSAARGELSTKGELVLEPPTSLGRVMRSLDFAIEGFCRARGALWRLTPWRRRRQAASFAALCSDARFAALRDYHRLTSAIEPEVKPYYDLYTSRFNSPWMAASLELSVFTLALCRLLRPARLLDLGSGFSSVVLRLYQREASHRPGVWSVDTSPAWLGMTRKVLEWFDLPTEGLATWREFASNGQAGFDFVLHDLGSILTRCHTLERVLGLAAPGGVVVIDDANYGKVRRHARRVLRRRGVPHHDLGAATRDRYGRYALLARL